MLARKAVLGRKSIRKPIQEIKIRVMDQRKVFLQSETVSFCLNAPAGPTCTTPDPAEVQQCPRPPRRARPDPPAPARPPPPPAAMGVPDGQDPRGTRGSALGPRPARSCASTRHRRHTCQGVAERAQAHACPTGDAQTPAMGGRLDSPDTRLHPMLRRAEPNDLNQCGLSHIMADSRQIIWRELLRSLCKYSLRA
jgi:hypothetical protein